MSKAASSTPVEKQSDSTYILVILHLFFIGSVVKITFCIFVFSTVNVNCISSISKKKP